MNQVEQTAQNALQAIESLADALTASLDQLGEVVFQSSELPESPLTRGFKNQVAILANMQANLKAYQTNARELAASAQVDLFEIVHSFSEQE